MEVMVANKNAIAFYLRGSPEVFNSARKISRRASGKRRFQIDPNWAGPILSRLVEKGILESDATGHYRLKGRKDKKDKKWIAPNIRKILEASKKFDDSIKVEEIDDLLE